MSYTVCICKILSFPHHHQTTMKPLPFCVALRYLFAFLPATLASPSRLLTLPSPLSSPLNLTKPLRPALNALPPSWPELPYIHPFPNLITHLTITTFLSPTSTNTTLADLAVRLFNTEIDFLTTYSRLFNPQGISVAQSFTDTYLTCHADGDNEWTFKVAIDMLRVLGVLVEKWGLRDFEFEIWEGELRRQMFCRV